MILKIYFYQSRINLYLILEMNWLSCGQIGLFPKKYLWIPNIYVWKMLNNYSVAGSIRLFNIVEYKNSIFFKIFR